MYAGGVQTIHREKGGVRRIMVWSLNLIKGSKWSLRVTMIKEYTKLRSRKSCVAEQWKTRTLKKTETIEEYWRNHVKQN